MWVTGRGDSGETGLYGDGPRVAKDDPRIEALGALDEAMSAIGVARAQACRRETAPVLLRVQQELVVVMSEVGAVDPAQLRERLDEPAIRAMEADITALVEALEPPHAFILPGDTPTGAVLDMARAIVRRAERRVVTLARQGQVANPCFLRYLNRLSTLLYLLARAEDGMRG